MGHPTSTKPRAKLHKQTCAIEVSLSLEKCSIVASSKDHLTKMLDCCKNHKAMVQLISKKGWQLVYVDYMVAFPNLTSKDDLLKGHLRDSLKDMKLEANNPEFWEQGVVQDDKLTRNLLNTK